MNKILVPILIMILTHLIPAQIEELGAPFITNYETEKFNANRQNWVAVQDRRGIMYFGNSSGILEFDGIRWKMIPVRDNAITRALSMGPDGTIYYGSIGDIGYLEVSPSGSVQAVSLLALIPEEERTFSDVWDILCGRHGTYFLTRSGIFRLENGKIHTIRGRYAPSQACLMREIVFYADSDKGICMLEGNDVVPIPQLNSVYNGKRVVLAPFHDNKILAARITGDFLLIDLEPLWNEEKKRFDISGVASEKIITPFPCELDEFIEENNGYLYKICPLADDRFAIGTLKNGVAVFDKNGKIKRTINTNDGLLDNTSANIYQDSNQNIWAMANSGISYIEYSVPQTFFGEPNNIFGVCISLTEYMGRLYVGTFQDLLVRTPYRFLLSDNKIFFEKLKNSPNEVWQFLNFTGSLLAATNQGLYAIQGNEAFKIHEASAKPYSMGTSRLCPGHLFLGLMGGMDVLRQIPGNSRNIETQWEYLGKMVGVSGNIRSIAEDINGNLWTGSEVEGLMCIQINRDNPLEPVIHRFGPESGLPGLNWIRPVNRENTLYVLTPKGLYQTKIHNDTNYSNKSIRFSADENLGKEFLDPPVPLLNMVFSDNGDAFICTEKEIVRAVADRHGQYTTDRLPFRGLPPPDPDEMPYIHPDGSFWHPSKGLYRIDLNTKKNYSRSFRTLVRKVIASGKKIIFEGTHGKRSASFPGANTDFEGVQDGESIPELTYDDNALIFEFAAAFYEKPGSLVYQYMLEGFDREWSDWTSDFRKEYTNLPEGKYRFRVRAKNIYGTTGTEDTYSLRILPPWHRTLGAYILWILAGGAVFIGIISLYTGNLRRQKAQLEKIVAQRTRELREASLTDSLTGLRNRRFLNEVLMNDVSAFIGLKKYLLNAKDKRSTSMEEAVFGIFLLDIDFFKDVNDKYGHDAGDQVLIQFASILKSSVRKDDVIMRVGGEEFLVVLKKTSKEYLERFATKIIDTIANHPFNIGGEKPIKKTCCIGYTAFPVFPDKPGLFSFEQSIMIADLALLYAKRHGRNQYVALEAGSKEPSGEEAIHKTTTLLHYAQKEGYLTLHAVKK